jgi:hypothetical protein
MAFILKLFLSLASVFKRLGVFSGLAGLLSGTNERTRKGGFQSGSCGRRCAATKWADT